MKKAQLPSLLCCINFITLFHCPYLSIGAIFLFAYSLGYATPVVVAASSAVGGLGKGEGATWANSAFASLLIFYGTYTAFDNVSKIFML